MKASAAKEKGAQRSASRLAHRASGPILTYPKTRIRGSRLLEAAFILAIIELTRRLHQAYQHAYDQQAADWVLPQNSGQTPRDTRSSNQKACDDKIAGIFGGSGAEAATVAEPTTLLSPNRNRNPSATYDHLAGGGVFHLYTNAQGTAATVGLYRPSGGRLVSGGEYDNGGQTENYFRFSYTRGALAGVTLSFVHVGGTHGGEVGGQYLGNFPGEPNRIGNIGGPGGQGFGYNHTHVKVFFKGKLTDPRKIFCK